MDLGVYEIECRCGLRFNPPDELSPRNSDVRRYVAVRPRRLAKHALAVGKPVIDETDFKGGEKLLESDRQLRHKRFGTVEVYANKDEREITVLPGGGKRLTLKNLFFTDRDGSYCYTWTVEAEDFVEEPVRAVVEGSEAEGWLKLKCPVCGSVALEWRRAT